MRAATLTAAALIASMAQAQDDGITISTSHDDGLLVFDFADANVPEYYAGFVAATATLPSYRYFDSEDAALAAVRDGFRPDVTKLCLGSLGAWNASDLIEPWDTSLVPAWTDLTLQQVFYGNPDPDRVTFLPVNQGATAVVYNVETTDAAQVASLAVFADPAFAGRISIPDNVDDAFALGYLATGVTDWTLATEDDFAAAAAFLRTVRDNGARFWGQAGELGNWLYTGEVTVAWAWSDTYAELRANGLPLAFERAPVEGSTIWLCGFANVRDGQGDEALAYDFINALLAPETTAAYVARGAAHANTVGMSEISAETLTNAGVAPLQGRVLPQLPLSAEHRAAMVAEFARIKAGD
ncbi:MAG: extracellular solute-binding protein [Rhodobacteraceae bacterium]|nr:extracellular solute-binding protein [Paracoccaceae bacterium]